MQSPTERINQPRQLLRLIVMNHMPRITDRLFTEVPKRLQPRTKPSNNKSFHDTLYQSAHNRYLLKTLSTLRESMALLGHTTLALPGRSSTAINEHEEIVSAIEKRDAEAAEAAARSHIRAAYKARMKVLFEEKS